jgi:PilZ domain-containing protein
MTTIALVIVCTSQDSADLVKRFGKDPRVAVFPDSDSLRALDAIVAAPPKIVALNPTFADTARGAGLVARLKGDPRLNAVDVRILLEDEDNRPLILSDPAASIEEALVETSRPLERAGTRAAVRFRMDRRTVLVNGGPSHLIDLSVTGAQVLIGARVRPDEPVRIVLPDDEGERRWAGTVVWSVAVPTDGAIQYRAGVRLSAPDVEWLEGYCRRNGGAPDLTFGA